MGVANLFADADQFPHPGAEAAVGGDLLAGALHGLSFGDDAGDGLATQRMGQRKAGAVTGGVLLSTVAGGLATPAEAADQRAGTHISDGGQLNFQLLAFDLEGFEPGWMGDRVFSSLTAL